MSDVMRGVAVPEPDPTPNNHPAIADIVASDLVASGLLNMADDVMARKVMGMKKYGTPLQPFNGRDTLMDLYQELIDAMKYARVALYEAQYSADKPVEVRRALYNDIVAAARNVARLIREEE